MGRDKDRYEISAKRTLAILLTLSNQGFVINTFTISSLILALNLLPTIISADNSRYTQARFNRFNPHLTVLYKMKYQYIKLKLAKAPKYSIFTGKERAVSRLVRLQRDEDVFGAHVLAILSEKVV
ncbi:hypothetical protein DAPPUDRAFT_256482 [Daphnia pulex]|uniref:Uncharacterized protein n=1 Tax=Daphnia pulex TaxID=6669 RepID=E9HBG2_DAPPU|nr:hypothetical protein DAPPUDRAFT_256482 [Daphnia pulex]|eukprot:EFX70837.1 hypothetical protein DAPPUDRAFT_256482 [Daphnia pulex]